MASIVSVAFLGSAAINPEIWARTVSISIWSGLFRTCSTASRRSASSASSTPTEDWLTVMCRLYGEKAVENWGCRYQPRRPISSATWKRLTVSEAKEKRHMSGLPSTRNPSMALMPATRAAAVFWVRSTMFRYPSSPSLFKVAQAPAMGPAVLLLVMVGLIRA